VEWLNRDSGACTINRLGGADAEMGLAIGRMNREMLTIIHTRGMWVVSAYVSLLDAECMGRMRDIVVSTGGGGE